MPKQLELCRGCLCTLLAEPPRLELLWHACLTGPMEGHSERYVLDLASSLWKNGHRLRPQ